MKVKIHGIKKIVAKEEGLHLIVNLIIGMVLKIKYKTKNQN